jgi:hypothetical protein
MTKLQKSSSFNRSARIALMSAAVFCAPLLASQAAQAADPIPVASGLNNPRGLKFGPDGNLYVAEGGTGGTNSTTAEQCGQVPPPVGPYTGSETGGRISKIDSAGNITTVIDTLPSSQTSAGAGGFVSGVADIAFIGNTMYAVLAGAGCSHGVTSLPNGVVRIDQANHTATLIADLSKFVQDNPTANENPGDFEPDGTFYSMLAVNGALYTVEPNHGEIDKVTTDGKISRVIDVSASQGHVVPTALAYHGNFYVGNLGLFEPAPVNTSKVWKVNPGGQIKADATGFDLIMGLAFDNYDRMYVLEMAANSQLPAPNAGRITRVEPSGKKTIIADGLMFPTGMTVGPDGYLYVSVGGFGMPPGAGQVVKFDITH